MAAIIPGIDTEAKELWSKANVKCTYKEFHYLQCLLVFWSGLCLYYCDVSLWNTINWVGKSNLPSLEGLNMVLVDWSNFTNLISLFCSVRSRRICFQFLSIVLFSYMYWDFFLDELELILYNLFASLAFLWLLVLILYVCWWFTYGLADQILSELLPVIDKIYEDMWP